MCIYRKGKSKFVSVDKWLASWASKSVQVFRKLDKDDGYATKDIRARIAIGKTLFMDKRKLLTGKLNYEQKKWSIKSTIWNTALYA